MPVSLHRIRNVLSGAAVGLSLLGGARVAQAQIPTSITFFGDSFTDTGNGDILSQLLLGTDLTPSPPYYDGRISNGLNWADYLAASFGRPTDALPSRLPVPINGNNYAIGTATTGLTGVANLPIGMLAQYAGQQTKVLDPTGLYVIFGGANDLRAAAGLNPLDRALAIQTAVGNIGAIAKGLYLQGARNFLIPLLPDIGKAPASLGQPDGPILTASTTQFNFLLSQGIAQAAGMLGGSNFMSLNLNNLFTNILIDAANGGVNYGLTNTTVPCLFTLAPCSSAVFADDLHPTTRVHQLIADAAYNRVVNGVDVAVVPEPASVVLTGFGLLLCGVVARRTNRNRKAA